MQPVTAVLITREHDYPTDVKLDFPFMDHMVQRQCPNVLQRFQLAALATTEHVYVQDDDNEIDIGALYQQYDGRHITNAMPRGMQGFYAGTGVTLIGYGAFFPRRMAQLFVERLPWWRVKFPDLIDMEADRFFTWAFQPQHVVTMPVRQIRRAEKMCERQGHYQTRDRIFKMLKELEAQTV